MVQCLSGARKRCACSAEISLTSRLLIGFSDAWLQQDSNQARARERGKLEDRCQHTRTIQGRNAGSALKSCTLNCVLIFLAMWKLTNENGVYLVGTNICIFTQQDTTIFATLPSAVLSFPLLLHSVEPSNSYGKLTNDKRLNVRIYFVGWPTNQRSFLSAIQ